MSSHNRPVEHSGGTVTTDLDGPGNPARTSTAPFTDLAATPIYDELAARFDLPHGHEVQEHDDAAPVDTTQSVAVGADGESAAMRPAC